MKRFYTEVSNGFTDYDGSYILEEIRPEFSKYLISDNYIETPYYGIYLLKLILNESLVKHEDEEDYECDGPRERFLCLSKLKWIRISSGSKLIFIKLIYHKKTMKSNTKIKWQEVILICGHQCQVKS